MLPGREPEDCIVAMGVVWSPQACLRAPSREPCKGQGPEGLPMRSALPGSGEQGRAGAQKPRAGAVDLG